MRQIKCPECRATLKVSDEARGVARCPKCTAQVTVDDIPLVGGDDDEALRVPRPPLKHALSEKRTPGRAEPVPFVHPAGGERPRRPQNTESSGTRTLLIVLGVAGVFLVVLCAGGGLLMFFAWSRGQALQQQAIADQQRTDDLVREARGLQEEIRRGARMPAVGDQPTRPLKLPPPPAAVPVDVAPLPGDTHVINLPDRVVRVASGGGGRFMVLAFGGEKKIGVFDLNDLKIHYVDVPDADCWVAAGMKEFVVYLPTTKKLHVYSLLDRNLIKQRTFNPGPEITSFCVGSASAGPLLVVAGGQLERQCRFIDLESLEPMMVPPKDFFSRDTDAQDLYWPAANGRYFGSVWSNEGGGMKMSALTIENSILERIDAHHFAWFVAPFADGKHVCTGGPGVLSRDFKPVPNVPLSTMDDITQRHMFVPAQSGQYYMHVQTGGRGDPNDKLPNVAGTIVFYALGNPDPLLALNGVPIPANEWPDREELGRYQSITLPRGVHFSPEAKALVVIPPSRDKLHLYRVDLAKKK